MSWTVTPQLKTLAGTAGAIPQASILGLPIDGGFFGGYISHTADSNPTHALIVAPAATGATGTGYLLATDLAWKISSTTTTGATSEFDGLANTNAIATAGIADHPAANFCRSLSIGGFTDWYLPARAELDIAYFLLKPDTTSNGTSDGTNLYSVPSRSINYTAEAPAQTSIALFRAGGLEQFQAGNHWSSVESSATTVWNLNFLNGTQAGFLKTNAIRRTRAFRRVVL
jgi:hypothetical protein